VTQKLKRSEIEGPIFGEGRWNIWSFLGLESWLLRLGRSQIERALDRGVIGSRFEKFGSDSNRDALPCFFSLRGVSMRSSR